MIRSTVIILFLTLAGMALKAQNASIKGVVKDEVEKTPVVGATVTVFLQNDSARQQVKSAVTDQKGAFEISGLNANSYSVSITDCRAIADCI